MDVKKVVKGIKPYEFRYKDDLDDGKVHLGVMAQELIEYFPVETHSIVLIDDKTGMYKVNYIQLIPILLKNIQLLNEQVEDLENKIVELENGKIGRRDS